MEGTNTVMNRSRRKIPFNGSVLPGENRCVCGPSVVLRDRLQAVRKNTFHGSPNKTTTQYGKPFRQLLHSLVRSNGGLFAGVNRSGIQAFVQLHGTDTSYSVTVGHCPLDGRGSSITRKKRRVKVHRAVARQRQQPWRKELSVRNHDQQIGR